MRTAAAFLDNFTIFYYFLLDFIRFYYILLYFYSIFTTYISFVLVVDVLLFFEASLSKLPFSSALQCPQGPAGFFFVLFFLKIVF